MAFNPADFVIEEPKSLLLDTSIESSYVGKGYRVNYLKSNYFQEIQELKYKPEGLTHILRFYNK